MLTAAECRKLAIAYRNQAAEIGVHPKTARILRNIANSFTALAGQFEMLVNVESENKSQR